MQSPKELIQSRSAPTVAGLLVLAVALLVVRLERFPEWDEAVYLSQSGGLNGIETQPAAMVASREIGTPVLIALIRLMVETLANTRLIWMVVSIALLVGGAVLISRHVDVPASFLVLGYGTYWVGVTFIASFYGYFIAAAASLLAVGCYVALRAEGHRQILVGIALGAGMALTLWFRQIEGFLVAVCLLGHSAVVSPRAFWRLRWRGMIAAAVSGVFLFVLPWVWDSTLRFGSVGDRIRAGAGQSFERGVVNHISDYWGVLIGNSAHYADLGDPPIWATTALAGMLIGVTAVGLTGLLIRRSESDTVSTDGVSLGAMSALWAVGIVVTGFFLFFIGAVRDRYLLIGMLSLTTVILVGVWRVVTTISVDRRWVVGLFGALIIIWIASNLAVTAAYERGRFDSGAEAQHFAGALHRLSAGRECFGVSRFAAPTIQFGSGCTTVPAATADDAVERVEEARTPDRLVFVWWPKGDYESLRLDAEEWHMLPVETTGAERVVVLWSDGS